MPSKARTAKKRAEERRQLTQRLSLLEAKASRIDRENSELVEKTSAALNDTIQIVVRRQFGMAPDDHRSFRQVAGDIAAEAVRADRARVGQELVALIDKRFEEVRQLFAQVPVQVLSDEELRIRAEEHRQDRLYAQRFSNGKTRDPFVRGASVGHVAPEGIPPEVKPLPVELREMGPGTTHDPMQDRDRPQTRPGQGPAEYLPPPGRAALPGDPFENVGGFDGILNTIRFEVERGRNLHGGMFASLHEAYGVLLEELDELWEQVRLKKNQRSSVDIHHELVQIAAVAIKSIISLKRFVEGYR